MKMNCINAVIQFSHHCSGDTICSISVGAFDCLCHYWQTNDMGTIWLEYENLEVIRGTQCNTEYEDKIEKEKQ